MARREKAAARSSSTSRENGPVLDPLAVEIAGLASCNVARLREIWRKRWRTTPPPIRSADVLMRLIAWRLQLAAWGDLDREAKAKIAAFEKKLLRGDSVMSSSSRDELDTGTMLTRDWRGTRHSVEVTGEGFRHEGTTYASLSEIARAITGTRWSGPRFFGLEERASLRVRRPTRRPTSSAIANGDKQ